MLGNAILRFLRTNAHAVIELWSHDWPLDNHSGHLLPTDHINFRGLGPQLDIILYQNFYSSDWNQKSTINYALQSHSFLACTDNPSFLSTSCSMIMCLFAPVHLFSFTEPIGNLREYFVRYVEWGNKEMHTQSVAVGSKNLPVELRTRPWNDREKTSRSKWTLKPPNLKKDRRCEWGKED